MRKNKVAELIEDYGFEDVLIFEEQSYETAFIGVTTDNRAVYDYELMVEYLMKEWNQSEEDAADFISYNDSYSYGDYPIIIYRCV